jgi:hypothetical protein
MSAGSTSAQEARNPAQREAAWQQDLQVLTTGLKAPGVRIAGGLATRGQKDFASLYPNYDVEMASLSADIPALTDAEVVLRLMRLIATAHVAHNQIQTPSGMGFASRLPVALHWFQMGLR